MKLKKYRRVARAVVKMFPATCMFDVERDIKAYRESRNGTDWEGNRALFRQVLHAAVSGRHK